MTNANEVTVQELQAQIAEMQKTRDAETLNRYFRIYKGVSEKGEYTILSFKGGNKENPKTALTARNEADAIALMIRLGVEVQHQAVVATAKK